MRDPSQYELPAGQDSMKSEPVVNMHTMAASLESGHDARALPLTHLSRSRHPWTYQAVVLELYVPVIAQRVSGLHR